MWHYLLCKLRPKIWNVIICFEAERKISMQTVKQLGNIVVMTRLYIKILHWNEEHCQQSFGRSECFIVEIYQKQKPEIELPIDLQDSDIVSGWLNTLSFFFWECMSFSHSSFGLLLNCKIWCSNVKYIS